MRIDAYNKVAQLYQANKPKNTTKTNNVAAKDKVEISQTGREYQIAKQAVNAVDDVRLDKVNDIKKQMNSGTYNVSAEEVADRLMKGYFDSFS